MLFLFKNKLVEGVQFMNAWDIALKTRLMSIVFVVTFFVPILIFYLATVVNWFALGLGLVFFVGGFFTKKKFLRAALLSMGSIALVLAAMFFVAWKSKDGSAGLVLFVMIMAIYALWALCALSFFVVDLLKKSEKNMSLVLTELAISFVTAALPLFIIIKYFLRWGSENATTPLIVGALLIALGLFIQVPSLGTGGIIAGNFFVSFGLFWLIIDADFPNDLLFAVAPIAIGLALLWWYDDSDKKSVFITD